MARSSRGRVVLATNAADNGAWLRELHVEAATEHGYRPLRESTVARFSCPAVIW
ncbi:MAG: hypothetical protein R2873_10345 [Caldilineaceae bacterium]